jgi:hypothetical protein
MNGRPPECACFASGGQTRFFHYQDSESEIEPSVDTFGNIRVIAPLQRRAIPTAGHGPAPTEEFSPQNVTVTAHVNAMFVLK